MPAERETAHDRLIRGLKFAEPEHHHCPDCNTVLNGHSASCDFFYCPNCRQDFLVLEGEILAEVA